MLTTEKWNAKRRRVSSQENDMTRRTVFALAILLVCAIRATCGSGLIKTTNVGAQGGAGGGAQQQNNDQNTGGQSAERVLVKRPIVITIATKGDNYEPKTRYKLGDKVLVEVTMTNTSTEPLEGSIGNSYFQDRPRLRKDGELLPYRKEVPAVLRQREKHPGLFGSTIPYRLEPNVPQVVHRFLFDDWYEQLEPGQYELTLRHRFWGKEIPAESDTAKFEVDL